MPQRREPADDAFLFAQGPARGLSKIRFHDWRAVYERWADLPNVARFTEQAASLPALLQTAPPDEDQQRDLGFMLTLGELFTLVVYGQLILEQAELTGQDRDVIDQIFDVLVRDFSAYAVDLHGKPTATAAQQAWALEQVRGAGRRRRALRARLRAGDRARRARTRCGREPRDSPVARALDRCRWRTAHTSQRCVARGLRSGLAGSQRVSVRSSVDATDDRAPIRLLRRRRHGSHRLGTPSPGRRVSATIHPTPRRPAMGEKTDKISGRAKQAVGAITGDEETKREGERQEAKGKLKGKFDSAVDKAQDALGHLKDKADRS